MLNKAPLHDVKVGVGCAASATKITGPIFFLLKPFNSCGYITHVLTYTFFCKTVQHFKSQTILCVLCDRITRIILWLPCLTNRTCVDVAICWIAVMLTVKKYERNPSGCSVFSFNSRT
jgi:hypothetical protein